jgi:peptidoglycan/LPS O-acetylase OafA/YrhL
MNYIPGLDGLRAISVLFVIVGHSGFYRFPASLGVTVFFFISGFLITLILLHETTQNGGNINVRAFYARRFIRLFPEQITYVLLSLSVALSMSAPVSTFHYISSTMYFENYARIASDIDSFSLLPTGHFWSLAVEEHFYLIWPAAMIALRAESSNMIKFLLCVIAAGVVFRAIGYLWLSLSTNYTRMASECRIDSIAFGCLLAVHVSRRRYKLANAITFSLICAGSTLVFSAVYFPPIIHIIDKAANNDLIRGLHEVFVHLFIGIGLYMILFPLYGSAPNYASLYIMGVLEHKIPKFIGRVSYGMYLWHFAFINLFTVILLREENVTNLSASLKVICAIFAISGSSLLGWLGLRYITGSLQAVRVRFGSKPVKERQL